MKAIPPQPAWSGVDTHFGHQLEVSLGNVFLVKFKGVIDGNSNFKNGWFGSMFLLFLLAAFSRFHVAFHEEIILIIIEGNIPSLKQTASLPLKMGVPWIPGDSYWKTTIFRCELLVLGNIKSLNSSSQGKFFTFDFSQLTCFNHFPAPHSPRSPKQSTREPRSGLVSESSTVFSFRRDRYPLVNLT